MYCCGLQGRPTEKAKPQKILKDGAKPNGLLVVTTMSTPAPPPTNGEAPCLDSRGVASPSSSEEAWPKERAQTLSELKKQRSAAKLLSHPLLNGHLGNGSPDSAPEANSSSEDSRMPLVSSNGSAVYYTPASGDPPILRLKQPVEEVEPSRRTCCCVS